MSLFQQFVGGNVELPKAPVPPRTVVYQVEHAVGSKSKRFTTESVFLGVDKKRPLSYIEMASLLLEFDLTPGGKQRHWLSRKEVSKDLQAVAPGRDWYWMCSVKSVPSLNGTPGEVIERCLNGWREALLPYILDEALPCPWDTSTGDDNDEEDVVAAPPSYDELMAMWLESKAPKVRAGEKLPANAYLPPEAYPQKVIKVG